MIKIILLTMVLALLSSCTWVELNDSAKDVVITHREQVSHCRSVGNIRAKTRHQLPGQWPRNAKKIESELSILARNEALTLGANTLVANNPASEGEQSFSAFICQQ